jgi:hypothetical protein
MTVGGGGNRNANHLPVGPNGRPWSYGLCNCFEVVSSSVILAHRAELDIRWTLGQVLLPSAARTLFSVKSNVITTTLFIQGLLTLWDANYIRAIVVFIVSSFMLGWLGSGR